MTKSPPLSYWLSQTFFTVSIAQPYNFTHFTHPLSFSLTTMSNTAQFTQLPSNTSTDRKKCIKYIFYLPVPHTTTRKELITGSVQLISLSIIFSKTSSALVWMSHVFHDCTASISPKLNQESKQCSWPHASPMQFYFLNTHTHTHTHRIQLARHAKITWSAAHTPTAISISFKCNHI